MSNRENGIVKRFWRFVTKIGALPRWEEYKHFFQIAYFRYLVVWFTLVPLLASLLEGLQRPLVLQVGEHQLSFSLGLPFSWELLWLSSLFFFLAYVVYVIFCPAFIKQYNQYSEYSAYGHDPRWIAWQAKDVVEDPDMIAKFLERLRQKQYVTDVEESEYRRPQDGNPIVGEKQTTLYFSFEGNFYKLGMPIFGADGAEDEDAVRAIFWEIFGRYSASRVPWRWLVRALLVLSSICFLVVLGQHIAAGFYEVRHWLNLSS